MEFSKDELKFYKKKLRRAFETRDVDKNGVITCADFDRIVQCHKELGVPEKHLKKMKAAFNNLCYAIGLTDDSKSLTYEEFEDIYVHRVTEFKDIGLALYHELFNALDIDEDGEISYEEWVHHNKALNIEEAYARASFDAMDINGDGKISKEEFVAYHKEYFTTAEDKLKSSILHGPLD